MTVSLTLFISASAFVRLFSVPLAVAMCVVAAIIPPIAAFSANRWDADDHWWDEHTPGEQRGDKDRAQDRNQPQGDDGAKPAPPPEDLPQPPPSRSSDDRTLDELLWEEELRGYNGERFGPDPCPPPGPRDMVTQVPADAVGAQVRADVSRRRRATDVHGYIRTYMDVHGPASRRTRYSRSRGFGPSVRPVGGLRLPAA